MKIDGKYIWLEGTNDDDDDDEDGREKLMGEQIPRRTL